MQVFKFNRIEIPQQENGVGPIGISISNVFSGKAIFKEDGIEITTEDGVLSISFSSDEARAIADIYGDKL